MKAVEIVHDKKRWKQSNYSILLFNSNSLNTTNKAADIDRKSAVFSFVNVDFESLLCQSLHLRGIISKRGQI